MGSKQVRYEGMLSLREVSVDVELRVESGLVVLHDLIMENHLYKYSFIFFHF